MVRNAKDDGLRNYLRAWSPNKKPPEEAVLRKEAKEKAAEIYKKKGDSDKK